ncbi:protein FAR1-RELATED SEQUENCE 5-like [Apium graveolens]|uniref:protein FAR1-RELATED SEQUENCE 5-like n=1 Tax=Apium graveolens TaxID=4045 RepID=UPI003D7A222D
MDKMFARFQGRKALKTSDNVVNSEVVDINGGCLCDDNVNYINLVDDCDEDVCVSEHRFENEDLHENSEFMHESSESRDKIGENRDKEPVEDEEFFIGSIGSEKKKRHRDKLPRSGCKFRIYVINRRDTRHWEITSLELNHNHDVVSPSKMNLIKRERHVTAAQKNLIKSLHVSGIAPRQQMNIFGKMHGGEEQVGFYAQHLRNVVRDFRKDNLGVNDAQAGLDLLHRLEEESGGNFFIRTLIDEEGRLKYAMPFVPFTGVNHYYQSVLFRFALMCDELKTTFEWVLGTWLEALGGKAPLVIITDRDQVMVGAIQSQLPNTTHFLCSWHISNEFPETLSTYYANEEFKGDFNNCIYHSLTEEIFEDRWKALILKYKLKDNIWLQGLYNLKHK